MTKGGNNSAAAGGRKKGGGGGEKKARVGSVSTTTLASLRMPTARVAGHVRRVARVKMGVEATVAAAAAAQTLAVELLAAAAEHAKERGAERVKPEDVRAAVGSDVDLRGLFGDVVFLGAGQVPHIAVRLSDDAAMTKAERAEARLSNKQRELREIKRQRREARKAEREAAAANGEDAAMDKE